jgi:hypothetical protein
MSMRKNLFALAVLAAVVLLVPQKIICQTETLGIVRYTPPKGWNKTLKENVVAFSDMNRTTGAFCVITVYGASPSAGNPQTDFTNEWNNLVVTPLKAAASPKTETRSAEGWTIIAGAASIETEGRKALAFLTVFSGFERTVSVLGVLTDQSYLTQLEAFVAGITCDKTALGAASALEPNGQPGKFGSVSYATPAGWNEQQFQDGVVFKPSNLPAGEHLVIQIMSPLNFSGTMEQALAQSWDEAVSMYKATKMHEAGGGNYRKEEAQKSFHGWEYIQGNGGILVDNGTASKDEYGLEVFVVKINNRFERVAVLESRNHCNYSRYFPSDRLNYHNDIEQFLFSLQFTDWKEPLLKAGTTNGDGIVGIWRGVSYDPTLLLTQTFHQDVFYPIFLSNGRAYFGPKFPSEGLYELNTWIPAERQRRYWGTYTFSNGKGVLKMPYADVPLRVENNRLIIRHVNTDNAFQKLNSVDDARFNGTYALGERNGITPTITFTADGNFTDRGAVSVLYHEYIDCINPVRNPGTGTYEVKTHSILFNYSDGRRIRIAFMGVDYDKGNQSPATLTLSSNEDVLKKQ